MGCYRDSERHSVHTIDFCAYLAQQSRRKGGRHASFNVPPRFLLGRVYLIAYLNMCGNENVNRLPLL